MADWTAQQSRLLALRDETNHRLTASGQYGMDDSLRDELGELSVCDNHPADVGSEVFERGKDLALRADDVRYLQHIDDALDAISNGTYGTCQGCGQAIPTERLEVQPTAKLCVGCKDKDEDRHPDRQRPIEEEFLWPGFARTDLDNTSATSFDGEDSWQAVARFDELPGIETDGYANMDDNEGIVDPMDGVSNELYKRNRLS